jgi:hypothetical protein
MGDIIKTDENGRRMELTAFLISGVESSGFVIRVLARCCCVVVVVLVMG